MQRLRRLASRRDARWAAGQFVAEGPNLLEDALRAGAPVDTVFIDPAEARDRERDLAQAAGQAGASVLEVAPDVLARACDAVTPQPVVAIVAMRHVPLESLTTSGLTVVCVGLKDPGNAGAVVRSATASGSAAVVFCEGAVDIYNPKAVRASAGSVFHLPLVVGPRPEDVLDELGGRGVTRIGTVARGGRRHDQVDWTADRALVLGSETHGLPHALGGRLDDQVSIPMHYGVESLNVAMAAAVLCFEAERQRRAAGQEVEAVQ